MKKLWRSVVALCIVGFGCTGLAGAAPVTFGFTGTVTDDPFSISSFGAPISGSFSFDSAAPDGIANPANGSFASIGPGFGFSVMVHGTLYSSFGGLTVNTANNISSGDQYGVIASDALITLELFLQDGTGLALTSDALPTLPPMLSAFAFRQFRLFSDDAEFLGTVDTLVCTAGCTVAEPGSLGLVLAALTFLWLPLQTARRRSQ
ncbi:MAG: hypothetical protein ABIN96_05645 [Rubrivivax sp.]